MHQHFDQHFDVWLDVVVAFLMRTDDAAAFAVHHPDRRDAISVKREKSARLAKISVFLQFFYA
jgi:hypothetical protein